ncbi:hypothetical protein cyc_08308 [Cyclospora cayetanensis]|uniref:Uncharacterized protein n=1 Tax=Cyclospora cayetanensis TaxID=88456 RepID=A0A1D3CZN3_9EIME|nr:hypothetical protein cyc_08308 [Cyclospora cayetanensis]
MGWLTGSNNPLLCDSEGDDFQQQLQDNDNESLKKRRVETSGRLKPSEVQLGPCSQASGGCSAAASKESASAAAAATNGEFTGKAVPDGTLVILRDFAGRRSLAKAQRDL